MSNHFDAVEFAPVCPPINPSVKFYSVDDADYGSVACQNYTWFHMVRLPQAVRYVEELNRLNGRIRYSLRANY